MASGLTIIAPVIVMVCVIGANSVHESLFVVGLMLDFGAMG
jgi:TctA family transporter